MEGFMDKNTKRAAEELWAMLQDAEQLLRLVTDMQRVPASCGQQVFDAAASDLREALQELLAELEEDPQADLAESEVLPPLLSLVVAFRMGQLKMLFELDGEGHLKRSIAELADGKLGGRTVPPPVSRSRQRIRRPRPRRR